MAKWAITFNKDGNTVKIETESAIKPSMDEANAKVLELAEREGYERQGEPESPEAEKEPAVRLLERYGITLTGIAEAESDE